MLPCSLGFEVVSVLSSGGWWVVGGGFRVLGQGCVQCTAHWHGETAQHDDMEHCTAPQLYIKWYTGSERIRKQESFLGIVIMNSTGKKN